MIVLGWPGILDGPIRCSLRKGGVVGVEEQKVIFKGAISGVN